MPSEPTAEAEQVVLQGLAGQVPDWYTDNITDGAELWAAWGAGPVAAGAGQPGQRVRRALQHGLDHLSARPGTFPSGRQQPVQRRRLLSPLARPAVAFVSKPLSLVCRVRFFAFMRTLRIDSESLRIQGFIKGGETTGLVVQHVD